MARVGRRLDSFLSLATATAGRGVFIPPQTDTPNPSSRGCARTLPPPAHPQSFSPCSVAVPRFFLRPCRERLADKHSQFVFGQYGGNDRWLGLQRRDSTRDHKGRRSWRSSNSNRCRPRGGSTKRLPH